jgi:hypothetical protein
MAQIYKIYMNQSLLIMADFAPYTDKNVQTIGKQDLDLEKLFNSIGKNTPVTYLFVHPDIKKIIKTLLSRLKIIKAAGGLVKNGKGEYLFIHRLGKWDLPKGKIEENEKMSEGAVREVEEECGIRVDMGGKFVLKETEWYDMGVNKSPKLIPQTSEDITEAIWLKKKDIHSITDNTYPLIEEVLATLAIP